MALVESTPVAKINITNPLILLEAKDPYLCSWADWYYLVIMAYWLENENNDARNLVEQKVRVLAVNENGVAPTEPISVLHKGFLLPENSHPSWSGKRPTKTGASTALILNGTHKGMIVIPGAISYSVGRMLNPENAYNSYYELKTRPNMGSTQIEYTEAQKLVLDKALASKGSLTQLYSSVSATLAGVKNS